MDPPEHDWRLWCGVGGGTSATGMVVVGELVFQKAPHQFSARAIGVADVYDPADDSIGEIGLLYGRAAIRPDGHASISAGLA